MTMFYSVPQAILSTQLCSSHIINPLRTIGTCSVLHRLSSQWIYRGSLPRIQRPNKTSDVKTWQDVQFPRNFSVTPVHHMFWERDRKGGYGSKEKHSAKELIRDGLKELRGEMVKWQDEMKEKFECDPIFVRPGDMDKIWILKSEDDLEEWIVTSDQDHKEGYSSGSLTLSQTGHGLFSGEITTRVPKDGLVKRSGYVNMRSKRPRKSFKREVYIDWSLYNMLELRVRGDGRSYLINISTAGYFDITWNDIYTYVLYTRGGPHWQVTRIPFSKFFLNSKGRVQDKQNSIPLQRVVSVGISAGDRIDAPFRLEIDYIGVYSDPDHTEEFAYEMYKLPKFYIV